MNAPVNHPAPAIALRNWRDTDLPLLLQLRNDVALQAQLLATARGSDMAAVRGWLARRTASPDRLFRVIADLTDDIAAGYLQAEREAGQPHTWRFGICLAPADQGAGRGSAALVALEQELAAEFNARQMILDVDEDNLPAIRCYLRLGFTRTGQPVRQVRVCETMRPVIAMAKTIATGVTRP